MKTYLAIAFIFFTQLCFSQSKSLANEYVCPPCGNHCDKIVLNKPGNCEHCGMQLLKKSSLTFGEIAPAAICDYIASHPNAILLDVRTKKEFENKDFHQYGTLKNAINIPIDELPSRLSELSAYKNREIVVYCSHSQRSPRAGSLLVENGFTKVFNMSGGMSVFKGGPCLK